VADLMTIYEKRGELRGLSVAYIGDGNNVANSLLLACTMVGMDFRIAAPHGYELQDDVLKKAQSYAQCNGSEILCTDKPEEAVERADVVYTDVWTSMGQEEESARREKDFAGFQINANLMKHADPDAIILHPLPAHHGLEVEVGILDGPQSVVFDQAENRMHAQKAILATLLGGLDIAIPKY